MLCSSVAASVFKLQHVQEVLGRTNGLLPLDATRIAQKTKTNEGGTQTDRQQGGLISHLLFFQNMWLEKVVSTLDQAWPTSFYTRANI
jgi:hypothetical protein